MAPDVRFIRTKRTAPLIFHHRHKYVIRPRAIDLFPVIRTVQKWASRAFFTLGDSAPLRPKVSRHEISLVRVRTFIPGRM